MPLTYDLAITPNKEDIDAAYNQRCFSDITALSTGTGSQTTGITKLTQRFTQLLLTLPGSSMISPNNGSNFINAIKDVNTSDVVLVKVGIDDAVNSVVLQMQEMEIDSDPPSERLLNAEISEPVLDKDRLCVAVLLITQDRETAQLNLNLNALMKL